MTPIKDLTLPPYVLYRYTIPQSRQPISASTHRRLRGELTTSNSNILQDKDGKLYILFSKSDKNTLKTDCIVQIEWEALLQVKAENIARWLNGGRFAHCYLDKSLIYEHNSFQEVEILGKSVLIALMENKQAKNVSYNFNYLIKK